VCANSHVDTTNVSCTAIGKLRKIGNAACSTDSAGSSMGVNTGILVSIVVEPYGFSLGAGEDRTTLRKDGCFERCHILTALSSALVKSRKELLIVDLSGSSLLVSSEDQINVSVCALLVNNLAVFSNLCEGLTIHLVAVSELGEDFLEASGSRTLGLLSLCSLRTTCLLLTLLCWGTFSLLFSDMDSSDLMGDSGNVCISNLDSANISIRSIKKTVKTAVSIDSAGSTVSMHAGILVGVIMESHSFSLSSLENWTGRCCNLSVHCIHTNLFLLSKKFQSSQELVEVNPAGSSVLNLAEGEIYVSGG